MKRISTIASMTVFLAACGGSGGSGENLDNDLVLPDVDDLGASVTASDLDMPDLGVPVLGAALAAVVDTADLNVADEFAFDTARSIDIDFDLDNARDKAASVSICTGYAPQGDAFDVDYASCGVQGEMVDGVFSHQMEVTNEFDSVMGVVWFRDASMQPMYQEFHVDDATRMKSDGSLQRSIVWR